MRVLSLPLGEYGAVAHYRMPWRDKVFFAKDGDVGEFFAKEGLEWDVVHTNDWTDRGRAVVDMLREGGAKIVADVDDWFLGLPKDNPAHISWNGENKLRYRNLLENADRRTASTPMLARRFDATLTPNFVDPEFWDWPSRNRGDECVLLVPAGVGRAGDYARIDKALQAFLDLPKTKIVFMNWFPAWGDQYPVGRVIWCRWVPFDLYPRMLRWISPDIVVSPMEHNDFNVAKSNLKWLEAAMVGACFVGERWGEYERTVVDGKTGVLADGEAEWTEALVKMALDPALRQEIAESGRKAVLSGWTWDAVGDQWKKAVLGE